MARLARVVVPGMLHHITQRGNRRQTTFFCEEDVELNPVRARLAATAGNYRWSSARAHLKGKDDGLVKVSPLLAIEQDWRALLKSALSEDQIELFREHERTGRVLGDEAFQKRLEKKLGRVLRRQKPGPKRSATR